MIRSNKRIQYSIYILAVFLLASCSDPKEEENAEYRLSQGKVDVTVSVTLPHPELVKASTRASVDSEVRSMDLLVFDKDAKFMERMKVDAVKETERGVSFTVRLDATTEKRIIHLVANSRPFFQIHERVNIDGLIKGTPESTVIPSLKTVKFKRVWGIVSAGIMDSADVMPLVMWGRLVLDDGIRSGTTPPEVQLLRAAACVEVRKGVPNEANQLNDFEILDITVQDAALSGFLAPVDYTGIVRTPTTANPVPDTGYLDATNPAYWPTFSSVAKNFYFYMYERNNTVDSYMSVLIRGSYKNFSGRLVRGYYKIVLTDENGVPLDAIRNHRYILTITGVNGVGYNSVDEAIKNPPSNALKAEVTDDHEDFPFITVGGGNTLAISNNEFIQYGDGSGHQPIEMARVYYGPNDFGLGTNFEYSPDSQLFQTDPFTLLPYRSGLYMTSLKTQLRFWPVRNLGLSPDIKSITDVVTIRCNVLSMPFRVTWFGDITSTFREESEFYVHDLIEPTDKNWNIRILDPSSTPWLGLRPSESSPPSGEPIGNSMVSELSSKYNSHAYLYVGKGGHGIGTLLKTSASTDGKPKVTRIAIAIL